MAERPLPEIFAILLGYPGLLWHHCGNSRTCSGTPGLPDLVITGPSGTLWRECKPHAGSHPGGGQAAWKHGLAAAGMNWDVWTPADVESGRVRREIEELL